MLSREMREWCELVGTSIVVELHVFLQLVMVYFQYLPARPIKTYEFLRMP